MQLEDLAPERADGAMTSVPLPTSVPGAVVIIGRLSLGRNPHTSFLALKYITSRSPFCAIPHGRLPLVHIIIKSHPQKLSLEPTTFGRIPLNSCLIGQGPTAT